MIGALWTGISGLAAQQTALDNESHNIANVNTIGYKSSRISFADQMYQDKIGKGSKILDAEKIFTQGNLKVTGVNYDLALSGSGFFAMAEANAIGSAEVFYTRAGNFRMGDDGNFQDAAGNFVQGWAMRELDPDKDVYSSNKDISFYNADYTKLITTKTIRHSNYIETYSAKATDYNVTAKADSEDIYAGSSLKTMANKTADVEALIENYVNTVQDLSENPDGPSSSSAAQVTFVKFKDSVSHGLQTNGDNLFVKFGNQSFTTPYIVNNYAKTLQNLADEITSKMPGMNVYVANDGTTETVAPRTVGAWEESTDSIAINKGVLKFESMIPGVPFTITSMGETVGGAESNGTIYDVTTVGTAVVTGSGASAVQSAREALAMAVAGKQQDVYDIDQDIGNLGKAVPKRLTYDASIYDKVNKTSINITQIDLGQPASIHEIIQTLNTNAEFSAHLVAKHMNGSMVIEPVNDDLADIEFAGTLRGDVDPGIAGPAAGSTHPRFIDPTVVVGAPNTTTTWDGIYQPEPDGVTAYELRVNLNGVNYPTASALVITEAGSMDELATKINLNAEFQAAGIVADGSTGDLVITTLSADGIVLDTATTLEVVDNKIYPKNSAKSGFKGAGAELLEMVTAIDQTASKGNLQLRLDTLGISDSAFGAFSVDSTGLISMKQDGAEFAIGQLAIAMFNNNRGLDPMGNNLYSKTNESGEAQYNLNNARTATVAGGTLELSEADLSESLVNLMVFQRAFEANAKSITSADELLNTLINLKR